MKHTEYNNKKLYITNDEGLRLLMNKHEIFEKVVNYSEKDGYTYGFEKTKQFFELKEDSFKRREQGSFIVMYDRNVAENFIRKGYHLFKVSVNRNGKGFLFYLDKPVVKDIDKAIKEADAVLSEKLKRKC